MPKSNCGLTDWNETIDKLSKAKPIHHKTSSKIDNGKARTYAISTDHANILLLLLLLGIYSCAEGSIIPNDPLYSEGAGASATAIKDGDVEALIADSSAKAEIGHTGAAAEAEASVKGITLEEGNANVDFLIAESSAKAEIGLGGLAAGAEANAKGITYEEGDVKVDFIKAGSSAKAVLTLADVAGAMSGSEDAGVKAKVSARADLADATYKFGEGQEINAKLGVNVDTGFEAGDGAVSASAAGFGASIGRTMGLKTPIGELNFKLW